MTENIEKAFFINAAPKRVFQALTEKEDLERWFLAKAEVDLRPAGALRFEWAPEAVEVGKILTLEPSHRLSYSWEALSPGPTTVTFELGEENNGTQLHLFHTGIGEGESWKSYHAAVNSGWDVHLQNLTSWLETGTCEAPGPTQ